MAVLRAAVVLPLVAAVSAAPFEGMAGGYAGIVPDLGALNPLHYPGGFVGRFGDPRREVLGGGVESEGFRWVGGGLNTARRSDAAVAPDLGASWQAPRPHDTGVREDDHPGTGSHYIGQHVTDVEDIDQFQVDPQNTDPFQMEPQHNDQSWTDSHDIPRFQTGLDVDQSQASLPDVNRFQTNPQVIDPFQTDPGYVDHPEFEPDPHHIGPQAIVSQEVDPLHVGAQDTNPLNVNSLDNVHNRFPLGGGLPGPHTLGLKKTSEEDNTWPVVGGHGRMIGIGYARNFNRAGLPWRMCTGGLGDAYNPRCRQSATPAGMPWFLL